MLVFIVWATLIWQQTVLSHLLYSYLLSHNFTDPSGLQGDILYILQHAAQSLDMLQDIRRICWIQGATWEELENHFAQKSLFNSYLYNALNQVVLSKEMQIFLKAAIS